MNRQNSRTAVAAVVIATAAQAVAPSAHAAGSNGWQLKAGPLLTRWAHEVTPENVHPEYPRPQMVREEWQNLNGLWDYAIQPREQGQPGAWDGQILVPFPVESALSGAMREVGETNRLWYRRQFKVPQNWRTKRLLLHFGAVDWETTVWVNGKQIGVHRGGYDSFTYDITDALQGQGAQEIVITVWDPTDAGSQVRGKQVQSPKGIWYTPTTGIWQTVWLEPVPEAHIDGLAITPSIDSQCVTVAVHGTGILPSDQVRLAIYDGTDCVNEVTADAQEPNFLTVPNPKLWSPDTPFLYRLKVELKRRDKVIDSVGSYFGMRKISLGKDAHGVTRIFLNDKPCFMFGPLDQGFWPDGLYTAPSDAALRSDIETMKQLGCNMARKHVKIEPERWYYWCDKLGLLVWQDMPNHSRPAGDDAATVARRKESEQQFETELQAMIEQHGNHPSIVMWVPFNEGWGQYDTERIVNRVKELDPSRLVDCASGWTDVSGLGDVHDMHQYPGPGMPAPEPGRAVVLGEFGGLGLPIPGHTWLAEKSWGYRSFQTRDELTDAYEKVVGQLRNLIGAGLSAAVYTQLTDVEIEVNGLMTYDRALIKPDAHRVAAIDRKLYLPPPLVRVVVPTSQEQGFTWRYTTTQPPAGWELPAFDDSAWQSGEGGFGSKGTPGAVVRTEWHTADIWMRRTIHLPQISGENLHLRMHHDEDVEVYLNGVLATQLPGYTVSYQDDVIRPEARAALHPGDNVVAVYCHQTTGGQYIDLGFIEVVEPRTK